MGDEFTRLKHFPHNVAAADELALDVKLRNRRPIGVILDALAQISVFEHIDAFEVHADIIEDLYDLAREAAHRKLMRALHDQNDVVGSDFGFNRVLSAHRMCPLYPRSRRGVFTVELSLCQIVLRRQSVNGVGKVNVLIQKIVQFKRTNLGEVVDPCDRVIG